MLERARNFRCHFVGAVLHHVREHGGDPDSLIREFALPSDALDAPWSELPLSQLEPFLHASARAANDPDLGIHVGQRLSRRVWDVMQLSCLSAPTLGEGLRRLPQLLPLLNDYARMQATSCEEGLELEHWVDGYPDGLSRHGNEILVCTLVYRARQALGGPFRARRYWFAHPRPDDTAALCEFLESTELSFGAGVTGVLVDREQLERPLLSADPILLDVLDRLTAPQLQVVAGHEGVVAWVSRHLRNSLDKGVPTVQETARALAMSTRSLQRELQRASTSYREIVDHVRQMMASELLRRGTPVDEIAAALGYSQRSAFRRAFARWTRT